MADLVIGAHSSTAMHPLRCAGAYIPSYANDSRAIKRLGLA